MLMTSCLCVHGPDVIPPTVLVVQPSDGRDLPDVGPQPIKVELTVSPTDDSETGYVLRVELVVQPETAPSAQAYVEPLCKCGHGMTNHRPPENDIDEDPTPCGERWCRCPRFVFATDEA